MVAGGASAGVLHYFFALLICLDMSGVSSC